MIVTVIRQWILPGFSFDKGSIFITRRGNSNSGLKNCQRSTTYGEKCDPKITKSHIRVFFNNMKAPVANNSRAPI